jgi:hypothetical protein
VNAQTKKCDWKLEDRIMMHNLLTWLFWSGVAVIAYSTISASFKYIHHWRRGARPMAAQAALQTVLSTFGLVALLLIRRIYMS